MSIILDTKKGKILNFFLLSPTTSYTIRELARHAKISPTWVSKIIKELKKDDIVVTKKDSNSLKVRSKRESSFIRLKHVLNIHSLYSTGLIDRLIEEYHRPEAIILFGSYSKGEDIEDSDIDIAIITDREYVKESYSKYEKKLKRKISIKVLNGENIEKDFAVSLANGIVLYGYFEV